MTTIKLPILGDALAELPRDEAGRDMWSTSETAKCWAAIVKMNGRVAGGLERDWLSRARGDGLYYLTRNVQSGDVLEVACDRLYGDDRRQRRVYLRVISKTTEHLEAEVFYKPTAAFLAARNLPQETPADAQPHP